MIIKLILAFRLRHAITPELRIFIENALLVYWYLTDTDTQDNYI